MKRGLGPLAMVVAAGAAVLALAGCAPPPPAYSVHGPLDLIECPQCHAMVPHASLHEHTVEMHGHRPAGSPE